MIKINLLPSIEQERIDNLKQRLYSLSEQETRFLVYNSSKTCGGNCYSTDVLMTNNELMRFYEYGYITENICIYDDKITVCSSQREFKFNNKIYNVSKELIGFTYDKKTKKIKFWFNQSLSKLKPLIWKFFKYNNYNWFLNMSTNKCNLLTKTLLEDIISGKITNQEAYLKKWTKTSLKCNIHYKLLLNYVDNGSVYDLKKIIKVFDNPNAFLYRVKDVTMNKETISIISDSYIQCLMLGKKLKWNWSNKRFSDEHLQMSRQISEMKYDFIDDTIIPIKGCLEYPEHTKCELIITEKMAYKESNEQHNCIHSSYWNRIRDRRYFVIACYKPERCSIGVLFQERNKCFDINQIYTTYNKAVKPETKELFSEWIKQENVQEFFKNNYYQTTKINANAQELRMATQDFMEQFQNENNIVMLEQQAHVHNINF